MFDNDTGWISAHDENNGCVRISLGGHKRGDMGSRGSVDLSADWAVKLALDLIEQAVLIHWRDGAPEWLPKQKRYHAPAFKLRGPPSPLLYEAMAGMQRIMARWEGHSADTDEAEYLAWLTSQPSASPSPALAPTADEPETRS